LREKRIVGHVSVGEPRGEGAVALWTDRSDNAKDEIAVLGRLFVHPDARSVALGERLTRTAMKWATEAGRRLVLDVMEKDQGAIRLYERLGWTEFGRITHEVPDSSVDVPARCYVAPPS
jgi:ribosomal protein S18 acetylase RimI-like enzyme